MPESIGSLLSRYCYLRVIPLLVSCKQKSELLSWEVLQHALVFEIVMSLPSLKPWYVTLARPLPPKTLGSGDLSPLYCRSDRLFHVFKAAFLVLVATS